MGQSLALGEGQTLKPSLANKQFVPTDQWRQAVQLIIDEAKMGIWRSMSVLVISKQGVTLASYLSLTGKVVLCSNSFLELKMWRDFLPPLFSSTMGLR